MKRLTRSIIESFSPGEVILVAIFICGFVLGFLVRNAEVERARHALTTFKLTTVNALNKQLSTAHRRLRDADAAIAQQEATHARDTAEIRRQEGALRARLADAARTGRVRVQAVYCPAPAGSPAPAAGSGHGAPSGLIPEAAGDDLVALAADADTLAKNHELLQNYTRQLIKLCEGAK